MNKNELKAVLSAFSDTPEDIDLSQNEVIIQVQDQLIAFQTVLKKGQIHIIENEVETVAEEWIAKRLAKLTQLAQRIIDYVKDTPDFIAPSGKLVDQLEENPLDQEVDVADAGEKAMELLGNPSGIDTFVLYLTSDAGEGKTTVINVQARLQAQKYLDGKSEWLLLPIPLGGRSFLRLDDVVVGSITNKYRFRGLYYESFIALVKYGFIVPAFDGFEEMFVESSSGEAVSSLSNLIRNLDSTGSVLVAARKAYFEIRNFELQGRLLDGLPDSSTSFARIKIDRWNASHFIAYWKARGLSDAEKIYKTLSQKFGSPDHPLLTRAVLVQKLADVAEDEGRFTGLVQKIDGNTANYFSSLIDSIIEREIEGKWVDRTEENVRTPLLTLRQHHQLLSLVATEMARESTSLIKKESLDLIAELYCDSIRLPVGITRQVINRMPDHPLIIKPEKNATTFAFDHDEFREFFLGEALANHLINKNDVDVRLLLRNIPLSKAAVAACRNILRDDEVNYQDIFIELERLTQNESSATYIQENCRRLMFRVAQDGHLTGVTISSATLSLELFTDVSFDSVKFSDCYFFPGALEACNLKNCTFENCQFESIELGGGVSIKATVLRNCEVYSFIQSASCDAPIFSPSEIAKRLEKNGFIMEGEPTESGYDGIPNEDGRLLLLTRALRAFSRATGVNDDLFLRRLGKKGHEFMDLVLPEILKVGLLEEVEHKGAGHHKRFKLAIPMSQVQKALRESGGCFEKFIATVAKFH